MVSALSARLLAGRGDSPSNSSSKGSQTGNHQQKRTASDAFKGRTATSTTATVSNINEKVESSISGYSADREDPSAVVFPPVVSIDLHGRENNRNSTSTSAADHPKRRKTQEIQFAATRCKDDLKRAGMEYKEMDMDMRESKRSDVTIKLKGVKLMHSSDISNPLVISNVSEKCSVSDYQALSYAVSDYYPTSSVGSRLKSFETSSAAQDATSSDQSTSSVSDTESDSGSDNINNGSNHILFIPPLVEDAPSLNKTERAKAAEAAVERMSPCNVISCSSNAMTMAEILQLSADPRLVTSPTAPYNIVHANAAFLSLAGREEGTMTTDMVVGKSFFSLLDPNSNASGASINLTTCMVSSSMGNDSKLFLLPKSGGVDPVKCSIRVSPVVARKTESKEVTTVTFFAIEFAKGMERAAGRRLSDMANASGGSEDLPVGVMG